MTDVLVIGGGPTGLLTACELLRRGVPVRVVDRAPAPAPHSKALLLWPRTLDVLTDLGVGGEVVRRSIRIDSFRYTSEGRELVDIRFPAELAARALPQASTEDVLRDRLAALGGRVEQGVRLLALDGVDRSGDPARTRGTTAILEHADGRVERADAAWVVGCDGAGSAVRAQLGVAFTGSTYADHFVIADARIDGGAAVDQAHYLLSARGALVVMPLPDGLHRVFASLPQAPPGGVDLPLVQRLLDERGPGGLRLRDPEWTSGFRVHRRQAERFSVGRVFLVGDAAHVHSPTGGQGLNTGLQDAHNLAWKLAAVVHGDAPAALLDSYSAERRPVAAAVVRATDAQTRAWMLRSAPLVGVRDAALRLAHRSGLIERGYLPVLAGRRLRYAPGASAALLAPPAGEDRGPLRVGAPVPPEVLVRLAPPAATPAVWTVLHPGTPVLRVPGVPEVAVPALRALRGCAATAFVVVRPDGIVAARGRAADADAARAWLTRLTTPDGADPVRRDPSRLAS
jgi:3-(3-hydroxy-phenyl)propionate hydroxylase